MVTCWMGKFQNEHYLKALGLQVSIVTCYRERLNSLKALDVDILTSCGIIVDP